MELEWQERRCGIGEDEKRRAQLPGGIGWVNLTRYVFPENTFAMHYMVNALPTGAAFSGMERYVRRFRSMDELEAAVPELLEASMRGKIAECETRIKGIEEAMGACGLDGRLGTERKG